MNARQEVDMFYMKMIEEDPCNIFSIENPKKEWVDFAISLDLDLINHFMTDERYDRYSDDSEYFINLDGLSYGKLRELIKDNPRNILKISNPDEPLKILAVKMKPELVLELPELTLEVWKAALTERPEYIKYIEQPNEILQEIAMDKNPRSVKYIRTPTVKIQRMIINKFPEFIPFLQSVDDRLVLETVNDKEKGMSYLSKFSRISDEVREALIRRE